MISYRKPINKCLQKVNQLIRHFLESLNSLQFNQGHSNLKMGDKNKIGSSQTNFLIKNQTVKKSIILWIISAFLFHKKEFQSPTSISKLLLKETQLIFFTKLKSLVSKPIHY